MVRPVMRGLESESLGVDQIPGTGLSDGFPPGGVDAHEVSRL